MRDQLTDDDVALEENDYVYVWGNNERRALMRDRRCRVLTRGRMRSVLVEFEDGERVVTSARALRNVR